MKCKRCGAELEVLEFEWDSGVGVSPGFPGVEEMLSEQLPDAVTLTCDDCPVDESFVTVRDPVVVKRLAGF